MIFNGKITRLRPITIDDAEITLKWRLSERAKLLQRGAKTIDEQRTWIASKLKTGELNFIIECKDKPVGMIALHNHTTSYLLRMQQGLYLLILPPQ